MIILSRLFLNEGAFDQVESLLLKNKTKLTNSPLSEDYILLHVEIQVRKNLLEEAADIAKQALGRKLSLGNELTILRQLAWIHILKDDIPPARSYLTRLLERTTDVRQLTANNENPRVILEEYFPYTERNTIKRTLHRDEHQVISKVVKEVYDMHTHTQYWSAILDLQSGNKKLGTEMLQDLISSAPASYYGMLAQTKVPHPDTKRKTARNDSPPCVLKNGKDYPDSGTRALIRSGLYQEATRQILWDISMKENELHSETSIHEALIPLHIASIMKEAGLVTQSLEYLARELPPWKFELILSENAHPSCAEKYLSVYFQNQVPEDARRISRKYGVSLPLAQSLAQYHQIHASPFPEQTIFSDHSPHSSAPQEAILSLYSSPGELNEYHLLKQRYPDLPDELILELLPGKEIRTIVKDILTAYKWFSES